MKGLYKDLLLKNGKLCILKYEEKNNKLFTIKSYSLRSMIQGKSPGVVEVVCNKLQDLITENEELKQKLKDIINFAKC